MLQAVKPHPGTLHNSFVQRRLTAICSISCGLACHEIYNGSAGAHLVAHSAAFLRTYELLPSSRRSTSGDRSLAISVLHAQIARFILPGLCTAGN